MDANLMHPSRFLRCADLDGQALRVTIAGLKREDVGGEEKWILSFTNTNTKALILNKVNTKAIIKAHGSETDNWPGKEILLVPAVVDFKGDTVDGIRIRPVPARPRVVEEPLDDGIAPTV